VTSSNTKELYGHCAKLIGWGEEGGFPYWIYMNTWGRAWGENGGFLVYIKFFSKYQYLKLILIFNNK
jgi:hypothetical protein